MEDRIDDLEKRVDEAQAYMAALAIAVKCICDVTKLDPDTITARYDELRGNAPPAIAERAGEVLAALIFHQTRFPGAPSS